MGKGQGQSHKPHILGRLDLGWLAALLLCVVAIAPLLRADTPCTHDGGLHYYRVVAMRRALEDGILFTRYLPDLAFGYGFPFFNYREIASYYLPLALHVAGLSLPLSLNLVYVLSIAGSAVTAYLLARDLFGPRAGLVAAAAYAYAPYQFLDALVRGNAPESVALALLPLILWAFRRLALTGRRRWFLLSVGSLTALYLTHNISSLVFTPLLVAYLVVLWAIHRREGHWLTTATALVLALGLVALFLGPALLERGYVQLHQSHNNRNNDFHYNFVSLAELLSPPHPVDTSLLNPPVQVNLGLIQVILAAAGLAAGFTQRDRARRILIIFFALAAAFLVWMTTDASLWLWERLPLIAFVQFPWRFVGRAALPLAILAAALFADRPANQPDPQAHPSPPATRHLPLASCLLPLATCLLIILAAFPDTYPPRGYCPKEPYPTVEDLFAYEHRSLVAADPTGSYFPIWVKQRPKGSPLEAQYAAGKVVARFDPAPLPEGAAIVEADYGPNRARVIVDTPIPFRARYLAFYFPGWQAAVDGQPVDLAPTDPEGLIAFDVPAGRHTLDIHFGETPLRLVFGIISILSLAILIITTILYKRLSTIERLTSTTQPGSPSAVCHLSFYCHLSFVIFAFSLLIFKLALVDTTPTPFRRDFLQSNGTLPGIQHPLDRRYADGVRLIGYDQDQASLPADGVLRIDLYLTAYARPTARYQSVIHLVGPDGTRWSAPDSFRPRGYTDPPYTTIWGPGIYALDSHEIEPLPGTPPGTYDIVLTVFDKDTLTPLSVLNEQGQPAAPRLVLGQVALTHPSRPAQLPEEGRLDLPMGDLVLLSADFDRDRAAPGDPITLVAYWQAQAQPVEDLAVRLILLAPHGAAAAQYDLPPTAAWHPTGAWRFGDVWRGQYTFHLPAGLESGTYAWQISLSTDSQSTSDQSTNLPSHLRITAPSHTFSPPTLPYTRTTTLGEIATLVSFDIEPGIAELSPGISLTLTLAWRGEETPTTSYHVFVHLLDPEGQLVAQSDGIPAGWGRPTTGWLPGEYIVDVHVLTIPADAPAGTYTLQAGLYDPGTGLRLADPAGVDAILLGQITVKE